MEAIMMDDIAFQSLSDGGTFGDRSEEEAKRYHS
jgi:hypothetical protein